MSDRTWRMTASDLPSRQMYSVPAATRAFAYAVTGTVAVAGRLIEAGAGTYAGPGETIVSRGDIWLFEVGPAAALQFDAGRSPILSRLLPSPGAGDLMLRADRVESETGARTPAHRHRGPGIRRLLRGRLHAEVGDHFDLVVAGGAWFESGQETVVGTNVSGGTNAFVRVMLLPAELEGGKSSFVAATAAEGAKPRAARIHLFGECRL